MKKDDLNNERRSEDGVIHTGIGEDLVCFVYGRHLSFRTALIRMRRLGCLLTADRNEVREVKERADRGRTMLS